MTALAPTVEAFFTQRLAVQRDASPHRRRLSRHAAAVLVFARNRTGTPPSRLDVGDIDATLVAAFLTDLETGRANSVSTRNCGSPPSIRYSVTVPEHAESIQRVLAIPAKRHQQNLVCFLTRDKIDALVAAPDHGTWSVAVITPCSRWPS